MTAAWILSCVLSWAALLAQSAPPAPPPPGTLALDWPSRRVVTEGGTRLLDTPVLPGATAHVFALAAAAEAGLVTASTTHLCRRVATADGRRFVCTHPELKRPLTMAEALAYACTDFFVDLAARLPRGALNRVRTGAGLTPIAGNVPWTSAVLGLAGTESSPRALLAAVARTAGVGPDAAAPLRASTRALVRAGLRGAPDYGPATAVGGRSRAVLVKAGTAPLAGGRALGLVLAYAPADAPTRAVVVAAPSGQGFDAPAMAALLLAPEAGRAAAAASVAASPAPAASAPAPAALTPAPPATDAALRAASGIQTVRIGVALGGGKVRVDTLPLEEYVSRVISGEGQPRAGAAAHEALAIVIRTFALANKRRHRAEGYDLCDSTHCQVMRPALQVARDAALATAGRVLLDKGQPAFVYYSANCGGIPALASEVWPGAVDYHPGESHDDACADQPGWSSELTTAQVERALRATGASGRRLKALTVAERTTSNRAGRLRAEGFEPATVSAYEFRMAVGRTAGWQQVRSTSFDVEPSGDGYRFRGVGYGHGVGLCVVGAGRRAARGETATQILRAYFGALAQSTVSAAATARAGPRIGAEPPPQLSAEPLPQIGTVPPPQIGAPGSVPALVPAARAVVVDGIRLVLPAGDEGERAAVLDLVRRARTAVAARAGVPAPEPIVITVHPTVDAFGHATGLPWWGAASSVGNQIDLLPLGELRRRGTLESTLRLEVAHVVLDAALGSRPAWVRAGAAVVFSTPERPVLGGDDRVTCPADEELLRPVSGGAQREALARAERCVRRQLAQGRAWRDIR